MITRIANEDVEYDPESTRSCFLQLPTGLQCECIPCRNFAALGEQAFPPAAHELFKRLGIDYRKPAEVYHNAKLDTGLHSYGGWFHFVGVLKQVASKGPGVVEKMEYSSLGQNFSVHCSPEPALVPKPFSGSSVGQLEFYADLPWVIKEAEAE